MEKKLGVRSNGNTGGELKWRLELIRQHMKLGPKSALPEHQKPRLFIDRRCLGLIHEMGAYRYPENKAESMRANPEVSPHESP